MRKKIILGIENGLRLALLMALCGSSGWCRQNPPAPLANDAIADALTPASGADPQTTQELGSISGTIVDQTGVNIVGAIVKLSRDGQSPVEVTSDEDGKFAFSRVPPGPFQLTISSPGLSSQQFSGTVQPGQPFVTPLIMLVIPAQVTEVHVGLPPDELADAQIKEQEKQRVLGVIPNFYVSYLPNAAPLAPKHKFELAWKSSIDPFTLAGAGFLAGLDQAGDRWSSYGQGAQGYAKRYGTTYVDVVGATFLGGAVLPSLLKQDPRYFYRGTGSKRSRILYALANSVICKGDNGRWQPNYSTVLGSFAAGGLANLYYPPKDRGGSLVATFALTRIGEISLSGIAQEFIFPKLMAHHPNTAQN